MNIAYYILLFWFAAKRMAAMVQNPQDLFLVDIMMIIALSAAIVLTFFKKRALDIASSVAAIIFTLVIILPAAMWLQPVFWDGLVGFRVIVFGFEIEGVMAGLIYFVPVIALLIVSLLRLIQITNSPTTRSMQ